jgi:hypothetical protein
MADNLPGVDSSQNQLARAYVGRLGRGMRFLGLGRGRRSTKQPVGRRWRLWAAVALLFATLGLRLLWGAYANHKLRSQLDEIRRQGQPASVEDVTFESVPDSQNAWLIYIKAAQANQRSLIDSPRNSNDEFRNYPPYPSFWMKRATDSEKTNAQAFVLARQARTLTRAQMRHGLGFPSFTAVPALTSMRSLANTLCDGAIYAHLHDNDVEALRRILDALYLARILHQDPFIISQLVGDGIDVIAMNTAQVIAPDLRLKDHLTRELTRQLILQLLDEEPSWRGFQASFPMERLATLDLLKLRAQGTWFIKPLVTMDLVRSNRNLAIVIRASQLRIHPQAAEVLAHMQLDEPPPDPFFSILKMPGVPTPPPTIPRYSRWFANWWDPSRYFDTQFRAIADRRATAIVLAAQLYHTDHAHWPLRLEELAPADLPAIPVDPFLEGAAMHYVIVKGGLPDGGDRPLIYYEAGHGLSEGPPAESMCAFYQSSKPGPHDPIRQYRDFARWTPLPSTQAVQNDPEKTEAPGNDP